ncbi:MAG: hypothetical protein JJU10_04520 [Idiomarina sp.]|nr:hypothetical protein [Idiomarina sp.]
MRGSLKALTLAAVCGLGVVTLAGAALADPPDWRATPVYTTAHLSAGFIPDPWSHEIQAGGSWEVEGLGNDCVGYINRSAPDIDLMYDAGSYMSLFVYVRAQADTTLVINAPDGRWYCNDDFDGLNPMVTFHKPQSGMYNIWVGVYGGSSLSPATVYISEINPSN